MSLHQTKPEHEVLYQDLVALIRKHQELGGAVMLAIAANMVGKLIALQDKDKVRPEQALEIVATNIEIGNHQMIDKLKNAQEGLTL